MDSVAGKKLHINIIAINNAATIFLSGEFSFDAHREFKAAYINQLNNSKIGNIVVNLADVKYLDSSALGMLLVMRDYVKAAKKALVLSSPSPIAKRTFEIAGFEKVFTIN